MAGMGASNEDNCYLPVDMRATGCLAISSRLTERSVGAWA